MPFISKATGVPLAKIATRVMMGATLAELRSSGVLRIPGEGAHVAVKEGVLYFFRTRSSYERFRRRPELYVLPGAWMT